jgi:hypothetical protein
LIAFDTLVVETYSTLSKHTLHQIRGWAFVGANATVRLSTKDVLAFDLMVRNNDAATKVGVDLPKNILQQIVEGGSSDCLFNQQE